MYALANIDVWKKRLSTVQIDQITQNPDLESDMRYLTELRGKVSG